VHCGQANREFGLQVTGAAIALLAADASGGCGSCGGGAGGSSQGAPRWNHYFLPLADCTGSGGQSSSTTLPFSCNAGTASRWAALRHVLALPRLSKIIQDSQLTLTAVFWQCRLGSSPCGSGMSTGAGAGAGVGDEFGSVVPGLLDPKVRGNRCSTAHSC
jgi:hypothetical protein